jgi:hypothetical protein
MSSASHEGSGKPRGRRAFIGKLATGAAAGAGALALSGAAATIPDVLFGATPHGAPDAAHWLDGLKGKHKQLVDAYNVNEGWPLGFAHSFLATHDATDTAGVVIVFRHFAMPIGLQDSIWTKYKIGESLQIIDPATKLPAKKNPFFKPNPGVLLSDDMAIDRLMGQGAIVGVCGLALSVLSNKFAANAGVSPEAAKAEWTSGLLPGVTVLPSGTWGVNRAQEHGCTYCSGG